MRSVAIVGGGFMGATHAAAYAQMAGRVRVPVVCSRTATRGQAVADVVGARFTDDLDAVLADPAIDAVDLCLPTPLHHVVAIRALTAGKHVLLEKPIALTRADAEAVAAAAHASGRVLMVAHALRFVPVYRAIARLVRDGALGTVREASAYRLSPPATWAEWLGDPLRSGGTPVDVMVHDFDFLNGLFGVPRQVVARAGAAGGTPAHVVALVEHEGVTASVEGSMAMPAGFAFSAGLRIVGEDGALEHRFTSNPAGSDGNLAGTAESWLRVWRGGRPVEQLAVEDGDPFVAEIEAFLAALDDGRAPAAGTPEQAIAALRVAIAVNRAIDSGVAEPV